MIKYLKKLEVAKDGKSLFINDKYEIDACSGCVYYHPEYIGDRSKDFPQWIFELVEKLQQVGIVKGNEKNDMVIYTVAEKRGEFDAFETFCAFSKIERAKKCAEKYEKKYPENEYQVDAITVDDKFFMRGA